MKARESRKTRHARRQSNRIWASDIDARDGLARQDLALAFAQIFTPKIVGRRQYLEQRVKWKNGWIQFNSPELDSTDLAVLLASTLLAARCPHDLAPSQNREALLPVMAGKNGVADSESMGVDTSIRELAVIIKRDPRDGRAAVAIRASLRRLMSVVVTVSQGGEDNWGSTHLVTAAFSAGGRLKIALNFRATRAVLGNGNWARVNVAKIAAAGPVERVLMHRLAALCVGKPLPVSISRLTETCWTREATTARRQKEREAAVRAALICGSVVPDGRVVKISNAGIVTFSWRPAD